MPMKQEGSRSNSATSNRPSKWSNATHNNNRGCRRGNNRRARIRRLSRRRKSLNSPLAAGRMRTLKKSRLEAGATKRARRVVPLHGWQRRPELAGGEIFQGAEAGVANRADLLGQAHLHEMPGLAAFQHAQSPQLIEPAHRLAHRSDGETQSAG